ncbi:MAG: DUF1302 family protein [Pseudomonadales bacterium]|nr:DUF1302 family protein [Pseudomonadales bacterium]MBP7909210.1 DUF1302 family protein [Pseudomonadales bacterium]
MKSNKHGRRERAGALRRMAVAVGLVAAGGSGVVSAVSLDTGNPDLEVKWDNTIRVSAGWRVEEIDDALGDNFQYDESDYKFEDGDMVAQRLDLYSELDLVWRGDYGARVAVAGWYDPVYDDTDVAQNPRPCSVPWDGTACAGLPSSYHNKEYSDLTEDFYLGPYGEVLDAFLFANHSVGGVPLSVKAGQLTTYWGMALFYPGGIAQSQHPIDGRKGAANPGSEVKELFLPLTQINLQAQLTPTIAVEMQYYFDWANTRAPEGGTFLAPADLTMQGPDQLGGDPLASANLPRRAPLEPDDQQGNWGVNFKFNPDFLRGQTVGVYYREFDEKVPWVFLALPTMDHPKDLGYRAVYAENTKLAGVSFDGQIGQWAVGGEVGYHMDTGLKSTGFAFAEDGARGDTWHALVNAIYLLDRGALWDTGNLALELTYDRLDDVTENEDLFVRVDHGNTCTIGRNGPPGSWKDNCATKDAWGLNVRFAPQWLQVLPSLDVTLPVSYQTGLRGNSAISAYGVNEDATSLSIGVQLDYKVIHRLTVEYADSFSKRHTLNDVAVSGNGNYGVTDRGRVMVTYKVAF